LLFPDDADAVVGGLGLVVDGNDADGDVEVALGGDAFGQLAAGAVLEVEGDGEGAGLGLAALREDANAVDLAAADEGFAFFEGDGKAGDGGRLVAAGGDDEDAEEGGEDADAGEEDAVPGEGAAAEEAARGGASRLGRAGDAVVVVQPVALGHVGSHPRQTRPRVAESCLVFS
jgi:hypothetical protein